jgi:prepilin-type N-terminal cleavage/methylation domain-containing protein
LASVDDFFAKSLEINVGRPITPDSAGLQATDPSNPTRFKVRATPDSLLGYVVVKPNSIFHRRGFTLVELVVATAILVILTGLAVPLARVAIKREKERELRSALWELRDAIDRYKDAAQLRELGLDPQSMERLIDNRPYRSKLELVSRMVLAEEVYAAIKDKVAVADGRDPVKVA